MLSLHSLFLKVDRAQESVGGMPPGRIIELIGVIEHVGVGGIA